MSCSSLIPNTAKSSAKTSSRSPIANSVVRLDHHTYWMVQHMVTKCPADLGGMRNWSSIWSPSSSTSGSSSSGQFLPNSQKSFASSMFKRYNLTANCSTCKSRLRVRCLSVIFNGWLSNMQKIKRCRFRGKYWEAEGHTARRNECLHSSRPWAMTIDDGRDAYWVTSDHNNVHILNMSGSK